MREIDLRRGTENGAAKFAAVLGHLYEKPQGGGLWALPSGRGLKFVDSAALTERTTFRISAN